MSDIVWCVRMFFNRSDRVVAIFATKDRALQEVDAQVKWINDYHGEHYAPRWNDPTLFDQSGRRNNSYGESIWITEEPLLP